MAMHKLEEYLKVTTGATLFVDLAPVSNNNATIPAAAVGWVSMKNYETAIVYCQLGTVAAGGTGTFTVQQAQDAIGTGAKTIGVKTQAYTDASPGTVWPISVRAEELDVSNGFEYIRATIVSSAHAALVGILVVREGCRYAGATLPA